MPVCSGQVRRSVPHVVRVIGGISFLNIDEESEKWNNSTTMNVDEGVAGAGGRRSM